MQEIVVNGEEGMTYSGLGNAGHLYDALRSPAFDALLKLFSGGDRVIEKTLFNYYTAHDHRSEKIILEAKTLKRRPE